MSTVHVRPRTVADVPVLFVGLDTLDTGAGGRLHDVAVAWIQHSDRLPVLDVVPTHGRAADGAGSLSRDAGQPVRAALLTKPCRIRWGWSPTER